MRLSMLRALYDRPGPWASVYFDASHHTEDAAKITELRWRAARESLTGEGCDPETLTALEQAVGELPARPGPHGVAFFATDGEVVLRRDLDAPPRTEIATYGPLPHVMPLVAQLGEEIPYLRVVVDHTGGAIDEVGLGNLVRRHEIEGTEDYPVHKVPVGGWSALKAEHNYDLTWRRNAGDVAEAVTELADRTDPQFIVVAGDPKSRPMLVAQLPERWRSRVIETDAGSRGAGADPSALEDVTVQAVAEQAVAHQQSILDRFRTQLGQDGAAGNGLHAVVTALQRGQVDTVLMIDDPSSTERLWIGPEPYLLADDPAFLRDSGVSDPQQVRADAAIVRALAGTDAAIVLVDPDETGLDGGVAALLRYADARR
ncbi:Vms1/Ankzf1 family peptidyl-tRNA hydrolase [Actinoplanes sp. DH11]|uniref:baeRF2 domain-containing protein n=1 Tax=Actinoplanes sp. DH11 TaxID=2857011 RepID=UPI001E347B3C|nr:Vms1/Ankzf1 family peptidyl-tRNA hydrolase [Actinoplanes sp. DH11]